MIDWDNAQQLEEKIMSLVVESGNAKSKAMEAIAAAKNNDFDKVKTLFSECDDSILKAHQGQSEFIQDSLDGNSRPVSLLMAHAEDHMMGAILVRDLAEEIIELHKIIQQL